MQFTFQRDDEGRETIHCEGVCVARVAHLNRLGAVLPFPGSLVLTFEHITQVPGVDDVVLGDAVDAADAADEAGFWPPFPVDALDDTLPGSPDDVRPVAEVTVDVDVPAVDRPSLREVADGVARGQRMVYDAQVADD